MADQKISQLSSYTPPIDTDVLPIVDISTSVTKKITWANIKATLKTYFDGIYPTTRLASKIIAITRNMTAGTSYVDYTGVGFTPTSIIFTYGVAGSVDTYGTGFADSAKIGRASARFLNGSNQQGSYCIWSVIGNDYNNMQTANVSSYNANDGFSLVWSKSGSPTGTLDIICLCLR